MADWGPILVVEDDTAYRRVLCRRLQANGFDVFSACDGAEGLELAREKQPDVIITDWMMPGMDGLSLIEHVRRDVELAPTYIVLLSHKVETDEKVRALDRGADDYLVKACETDELIARVRAGMRVRVLQRELLHQASIDGLTGLVNRRQFFSRLDEELRRSERYEQSVALAMIDLDELKTINDTYGHLAGDAAIRHAAEIIEQECRATDVVARYGGDEFAVLFISADAAHAVAVLTRISDELARRPLRRDGHAIHVGLSYGIASIDDLESRRADDFVQLADEALYEMKATRKADRA